MTLSSRSRRAIGVAAFLTLVSVHLNVEQMASQADEQEPIFKLDEAIYLPATPVLRGIALGRNTFMADLMWLRALSYFAVHFQGDKDYRWLDPLIATVLELDPEYRKVYHWAAVVVMYGRGINNQSVLASNRLVEAALDRFPDDWELHFLLGCNLTFELQSDDPEQASEWARRGAEHIRIASTMEGAPSWLPLTAAGIHSKLGQQELAIRHLEEVYLRTESEELKEELAALIVQKKSANALDKLRADRTAFLDAWKGSFPFLPPTLFSIVGERMTAKVPTPWVIRDDDVDRDADDEAPQPASPQP